MCRLVIQEVFSYPRYTAQKMKFPLRVSDFLTFTEEILNGEHHFLCSYMRDKKLFEVIFTRMLPAGLYR